jgi:Holliday junction DNA helicase RuvA
MIGKLKGRIDSIYEDSVILDVGGVGYHVFCSSRTLALMPSKGEAFELITHTHVREDHIHLFGFPDASERDWFLLLMTVQGVGVKMAMAILSVFSPQQFAQAIAAKDVKALTQVSGVGAKLAERLTTELKNKVAKLPAGDSTIGAIKGRKGSALPPATASEDAISALVNLGYGRSEAYSAVAQAAGRIDGTPGVEMLIKESLKALAR